MIPNRASHQALLGEALDREWALRGAGWESPSTVYFGGGTPSLYQGIDRLLKPLNLEKDVEVTIEANPEEMDFERYAYFRSLGINRLSLGVQSFDDRSLQTLERIHSAGKAKRAILDAKRAGFDNISIDLMYDLPGQTEESFRYTLDQLDALPIQHLSLYNLTIEPHTPFFKRKVEPLQGERSLRLLMMALEKLESVGLKRYEISAFAKIGFEARHNLGYWTARPFLGLGPSAFSYIDGSRLRNICNLHRYARLLGEGKLAIDFSETLPYPANAKELLAIRLRVREGAPLSMVPQESEQAIFSLEKQGLLRTRNERLELTMRGMLMYDTVASEII